MDLANSLAFLVFPYLALTTFVIGHGYRYLTDPLTWNARSSEFLDKDGQSLGITLFHWGVILTFVGHAGGLLIPQRLFDVVGIDGQAHTAIAYYSGLVVGAAALIGAILVFRRRLTRRRIRAITTTNDFITVGGLIFVIAVGLYNVIFGHYYLLDTIAPWIRSIVIFRPAPELMRDVPLSYKVHILSALLLLGYSPFSRLIHIWSLPLTYLLRSHILFRRRVPSP